MKEGPDCIVGGPKTDAMWAPTRVELDQNPFIVICEGFEKSAEGVA